MLLDGEDVSDAIRTPEVSETGLGGGRRSRRCAPRWCEKQRALLAHGDWVAEGRDIGTVVAPDAELKVYLDADPAERARRRAAESGGEEAGVLKEMRARDERDRSRDASPLREAEGAVRVDTTGLSVEEVVERIAALAGRPG